MGKEGLKIRVTGGANISVRVLRRNRRETVVEKKPEADTERRGHAKILVGLDVTFSWYREGKKGKTLDLQVHGDKRGTRQNMNRTSGRLWPVVRAKRSTPTEAKKRR